MRVRVPWSVAACAALTVGVFAGGAPAEEMPSLKVFAGTPVQKGQWRMEILSMAKAGDTSMVGKSMTLCLDSAMEMAKAQKDQEPKSGCTFKTLKDTATAAVMENTCGGETMRSTITREGPKAFLVEVTKVGGAEPLTFKGRYAYEGPCAADAPVISMGKDSEACKQAKTQLTTLDPAKLCGSLQGAARTQCETQITQSRRQIEAMCK
jgi:hypothetical protein